MSQDDLTPERNTAPAGVPATATRAARPPARSSGTLALALLLALIALVGTAYVAWRQWQVLHLDARTLRVTAGLEQRVNTLEHNLSGATGQNNLLSQRLNDADQVNRSLREELLSQDQRVRDLEEAVGRLSEKTLSGQDAMRLDETEALLRMGAERYTLFHDAQSAAQAFALAEQTLAGVNDNAFNGVRQSIDAEHEALLKSQPADRQQLLDNMAQLRNALPELALKPLDQPVTGNDSGVWARIRHALYSVVQIQRDNGAPIDIADARIAREMVALDLAQAQAALIAWDNAACSAALKRADAGLAAQFDLQSPPVQQAREQLATLGNQLKPAIPVTLGGALAELRNLRAVHALKPAAESTAAPAPAGNKP
ncbi:uroporphyrinogen-III C-methyltransferase [Dyella acidiphila]|uniref:Uroporphyrinogen-III C-methyltransferase n=1 Tax=Dyella acidiphila TaxID=2775866 RepID=A0ABR9G8C2_9GAMM|nr:uroporphyrinogen-III C-methyltransferase [Dyella acidiphila]MBE1160295.1 uroporphyrinogen-III C-methyltransferase [Dyella acidiphila]